MKARMILAAALLVATGGPLAAAEEEFTGVRGWASFADNAASGVVVVAFGNYDRGLAGTQTAVSAPTGDDGRFALRLPPGTYHLVAVRAAAGRPADLREGDLFCYFGGNPVRVEQGRTVSVGFQLSRVGRDPEPAPPSGLSGVVFDEGGKPLAGAVVYLYPDARGGFKGLPGQFARTREDGTFRFHVRKGTFFAVVRKRESGDMFGPALVGDRFGFYPWNPIVLGEGQGRGIRVDAVPRRDVKERMKDGYVPGEEIVLRARLEDPEGRPLAGVRLLAYRTPAMTGFPAFVSAKSGADGMLTLLVGEEGTYYLLARERLGGPAGEGEWYGKYSGSADHSVYAARKAPGAPIRIVLERR